ncbi:hypothetical protein CEXT_181111, partial [Caerostris extrusa]
MNYYQHFSEILLKMRKKFLHDTDSESLDEKSNDKDISNSADNYSPEVLNQWKKWKKLPSEAEDLILRCLRQGLMEEALTVLVNMGIDINSKLLDIFRSTSEKDIRALMKKELLDRNLLTQNDHQSLQFISLLEKLHPCTSFEHARILLDEKRMLKEDTICAVPVKKDNLEVGDFMDFNQDNSESGSYCRIVLNWLSAWDSDVKGRILAPHYLKNSPVLDYFVKKDDGNEINKLSVWSYLLEHGNLSYLINWIDIWLGAHPQNSGSVSSLDKWPLSQEMINSIPQKSAVYVAETLLNALARHGIFCKEELDNFSLFLTRIGKSQCDINDASIFSSEHSNLSFPDLCHRLIFCMAILSVMQSFSLNLTKSFYLWSKNHSDSQIAFNAVAGLAEHIYKLQNTSSSELLVNFTCPIISWNFAVQVAVTVRVIFRVKDMLRRSLYELLKGSTEFDTSQLFGWQSMNNLKAEESQNELPHFSLKSLSEQYGLKKDLTYLYYLMEGRPNYSYLKFMAQEVVLETGLSIS